MTSDKCRVQWSACSTAKTTQGNCFVSRRQLPTIRTISCRSTASYALNRDRVHAQTCQFSVRVNNLDDCAYLLRMAFADPRFIACCYVKHRVVSFTTEQPTAWLSLTDREQLVYLLISTFPLVRTFLS